MVRAPGPGQQTPGSLSPGGLHAAPGAGRTQVVSQPWPPSSAECTQGHWWPACSPRPAERGERLQLCLRAGAKQSLSGPAWLEGPWSWKPRSVVGRASRVHLGPCPTLGTRPAGGPAPGEGDVGGCCYRWSSTDRRPWGGWAPSPYGAAASSCRGLPTSQGRAYTAAPSQPPGQRGCAAPGPGTRAGGCCSSGSSRNHTAHPNTGSQPGPAGPWHQARGGSPEQVAAPTPALRQVPAAGAAPSFCLPQPRGQGLAAQKGDPSAGEPENLLVNPAWSTRPLEPGPHTGQQDPPVLLSRKPRPHCGLQALHTLGPRSRARLHASLRAASERRGTVLADLTLQL